MFGSGGISIWQLIIFAIGIAIFLLPTVIAIKKQHPQKVGIILVNLLGGLFFGLGWIVALVWCFIVPKASVSNPQNVSEELARLHRLKEDEVISQEDFDKQKQLLLDTKPND